MRYNLVKRLAKQRIEEYKMKSKKTQVVLLMVALAVLVVLSACSGNYRLGDTSKTYCAAVTYDKVKQLEVTTVKSGDDISETTVEH